jgi:hypothetical protein
MVMMIQSPGWWCGDDIVLPRTHSQAYKIIQAHPACCNRAHARLDAVWHQTGYDGYVPDRKKC